MIFTLEALQAKHGDCLVLHYGPNDDPKIIVIDGGPGGVYKDSLKPRLLEIRDALTSDDSLPLAMLMVSHMDDDHVNGVLDVMDDVREAVDNSESPDFDVEHMWFNTFDDIVGNLEIPRLSGLGRGATVADLVGMVPQYRSLNHYTSAVMASTGQGRDLRDAANRLNVPVNTPFSPIGSGAAALVRGDTDESNVDWGDGLTIQVLHPNDQRLKDMQEKWDKDLKKAAEKGDESIIFASLGGRDTSPFNLASIVCLVEFDGKQMLLTGDARDDDILDGLRGAGRMDANDHIHVDILKIPHHGSDRNMSREFFERVTADHYVISGNGEHHNPEKATLVMLSDGTRGRDDFTVHLTNQQGKHQLKEMLDEFSKHEQERGRKYEFNYRSDNSLSLSVNLLDPIDY